jgi:O-methyltransferase
MKDAAKKIINSCLKPLELEVRRIESPRLFPQIYDRTINELMGALQTLGFPPLPEDTLRVPLMMQLMGTGISECAYLLDLLRKSFAVPGDVCEFGVADGATSALMANEIRATDKNLWLFDSFQGLPKPSEKDRLLDDILHLGAIECYEGTMSFPVSGVKKRLQDIHFPESRIKIVPGFIEDTLARDPTPSVVAFSYVDLDFYDPIRVALNFLHGVTAAGGFVMIDDYGFLSEGAKTAVDEFYDQHHNGYEKITPYPFAGAFIILRKIG